MHILNISCCFETFTEISHHKIIFFSWISWVSWNVNRENLNFPTGPAGSLQLSQPSFFQNVNFPTLVLPDPSGWVIWLTQPVVGGKVYGPKSFAWFPLIAAMFSQKITWTSVEYGYYFFSCLSLCSVKDGGLLKGALGTSIVGFGVSLLVIKDPSLDFKTIFGRKRLPSFFDGPTPGSMTRVPNRILSLKTKIENRIINIAYRITNRLGGQI